MAVAFVALGSNLGDRALHLAFARESLGRLPGTDLLAESAIEETVPLGGREQPPYLNQMVAVETALSPRDLLRHCLAIEEAAGRRRTAGRRWESRTLDLDLVRYAGVRMEEEDLTLPHPALPDRAFWQRELAELASALAAARESRDD